MSMSQKLICLNSFRNNLLFNFVDIPKPQKLSARPKSFCELDSQVPTLFAALPPTPMTSDY